MFESSATPTQALPLQVEPTPAPVESFAQALGRVRDALGRAIDPASAARVVLKVDSHEALELPARLVQALHSALGAVEQAGGDSDVGAEVAELTVRECATRLGVPRQDLLMAIERKELAARRVGVNLLVSSLDLAAYAFAHGLTLPAPAVPAGAAPRTAPAEPVGAR